MVGTILGLALLGLVVNPARVRFVREVAALWRPGSYLILFQNDAELRPTGGFIGSYALVTVGTDGDVRYDVETNIYKRDLDFAERQPIAPPEPLAGIVDRWTLRDSNWELDPVDALKTVQWFYEAETGTAVDGVVALTARAVQALTARVGALTLADGTRLTVDSFYDTLHRTIEKEYFYDPAQRAENEPKQVLADLVPQLTRKVNTPIGLVRTADWLQQMLATKQLVLTFNDDRAEQVGRLGWDGRIDSAAQHYLTINNANVGGMKSSRFIEQSIELIIDSGQPASYTLALTRRHTGTGEWPDHRNDNLVRIAVPAGASVTEAAIDGTPVDSVVTETSRGRAVVGYRMDVEPQTQQVLAVTFSVPVDVALEPAFVWQRQIGTAPDRLRVTFDGRTLVDGTVDRDQRIELQ